MDLHDMAREMSELNQYRSMLLAEYPACLRLYELGDRGPLERWQQLRERAAGNAQPEHPQSSIAATSSIRG